jgi:hypothetical protein
MFNRIKNTKLPFKYLSVAIKITKCSVKAKNRELNFNGTSKNKLKHP